MEANHERYNRSSVAEQQLHLTCQESPVVKHILAKYGDTSLSTYLRTLALEAKPSYQPRDDLFDVIFRYASPLLGRSVAQRVVRDIATQPVVLTSNHHGVDYFSQSMQASLIFSLNKILGINSTTTVPVFSCGNIPLNNTTYPRGALLYHVHPDELDKMPQKLPIFSKRYKTQMISVTPAFSQSMVRNAEERFDNLVRERHISSTLTTTFHTILQEDYCASAVIAQPDYSQQTTLLNSRIWKRLFANPDSGVDVVHLEQEKMVSELLELDLYNPQSLAWGCMFDPELRESILTELNGVSGCWQQGKLVQRFLHSNEFDEASKRSLKGLEASGTIFFWGIDRRKRRIPLYLDTHSTHNPMLRGVDDRGNLWQVPYTPQAILHEIRHKRLLPSGFTCFLVLSFARGLTCLGGYFQCDYLPAIQRGIVTALQNISKYHEAAHLIAQVPTDRYLYGMLAVMLNLNDHFLLPTGPVEIIARGGISKEDIEKMASLTLREAHLAALSDTLLEVKPPALGRSDWKKQLTRDCFRLLQKNIIIK